MCAIESARFSCAFLGVGIVTTCLPACITTVLPACLYLYVARSCWRMPVGVLHPDPARVPPSRPCLQPPIHLGVLRVALGEALATLRVGRGDVALCSSTLPGTQNAAQGSAAPAASAVPAAAPLGKSLAPSASPTAPLPSHPSATASTAVLSTAVSVPAPWLLAPVWPALTSAGSTTASASPPGCPFSSKAPSEGSPAACPFLPFVLPLLPKKGGDLGLGSTPGILAGADPSPPGAETRNSCMGRTVVACLHMCKRQLCGLLLNSVLNYACPVCEPHCELRMYTRSKYSLKLSHQQPQALVSKHPLGASHHPPNAAPPLFRHAHTHTWSGAPLNCTLGGSMNICPCCAEPAAAASTGIASPVPSLAQQRYLRICHLCIGQ